MRERLRRRPFLSFTVAVLCGVRVSSNLCACTNGVRRCVRHKFDLVPFNKLFCHQLGFRLILLGDVIENRNIIVYKPISLNSTRMYCEPWVFYAINRPNLLRLFCVYCYTWMCDRKWLESDCNIYALEDNVWWSWRNSSCMHDIVSIKLLQLAKKINSRAAW